MLGTAALTAQCADPAHAQTWEDRWGNTKDANDDWTRDEIERVIEVGARYYGADAALLKRVAWRESKYNPGAYNPKGPYYGIFQFHPKTWWSMSRSAGEGWERYGPYHPVAAAMVAAWAFAHGLKSHWPTAY